MSAGGCPVLPETTSRVATDRVAPLPNALNALTTTRTRWPASRRVRTSDRFVAPLTGTQLPPYDAQSYHV